MNRRSLILLFLGVVVLLGVSVPLWMSWRPAESLDITLRVSGEPDRRVEVRIVADGQRQKVTKSLPAEIRVRAHRSTWEVLRDEGPPEEQFSVDVDIDSLPSAGGSASDFRVLRGGISGASGWRRTRCWIASSRR